MVGVHTPEFPFERKTANVRAAIAQNKLRYPVVQDNGYGIWNAFGNQYWPAKYLIDARGRVRYTHFGEGDDKGTESAIRALLAEAGDAASAPAPRRARAIAARHAARRRPRPTSAPSAPRAGWRRPVPGTRSYPRRRAGRR